MSYLSYIFALLAANWREHYTDIRRALFLSGFMFVQNFLFFLLWVLFFGSIGEIRGWRLHDVSLLYGVVTFAVGLSMFLCDGIRNLPLRIQDQSFDAFIVRPRHPLPALMFSRSNASSLGDLLSTPLYWFVFGDMTVDESADAARGFAAGHRDLSGGNHPHLLGGLLAAQWWPLLGPAL